MLDVLSDSSIAACAAKVPSLDILVNNAGAGYNMPVADISITEAKKLFDLNVWSCLSAIQAFLPLLVKSKGLIANNTSVASVLSTPFMSTYNASKAAMATFSESLRLEMAAFDINVVDLKTGGVETNFRKNQADFVQSQTLPIGSIYEPAREQVEKALRGDVFEGPFTPAREWGKQVSQELMKKNPPLVIWKGSGAAMVRYATALPTGSLDGSLKKGVGMDLVERILRSK